MFYNDFVQRRLEYREYVGKWVLFLVLLGSFLGLMLLSNFEYSNSKIVNVVDISLSSIWANVVVVFSSLLAVYGVIFVCGFFVAWYHKRSGFIFLFPRKVFDEWDLFLFLVTGFLLFGSVPYTQWTFGRFMGIVPFFVGIIFIRMLSRVIDDW